MGQQPNMPLDMEDLPRATAHPPASDRWQPHRPGELTSPKDVPWGGAFGTPGPDTGYALRLIEQADLPGAPQHRDDVAAAALAVVSARASALGRAPVPKDVVAAIRLADLDKLGADRRVAGIAHDQARLRALVASIPRDRLIAPVDRLIERS